MRDIKFRAWNKEEKIMVYDNEDDSSDYWDGAIGSDIAMVNSILKYDEEYSSKSKYVWMQYTGLKDKNNKEIYEGDILKIPSFEEGYILSEVRWNDEMARFIINNHGSNKIVEVIGNKYANPELLPQVISII